MVKRLARPPETTARTFPTESERSHLTHFFHAEREEQVAHLKSEHGVKESLSSMRRTTLADLGNFHRQQHLDRPLQTASERMERLH